MSFVKLLYPEVSEVFSETLREKTSNSQWQNFMARHRTSRSKYKKLSDSVFTKTGLPLSRLLFTIIGILIVGGLIAYAFQANDKSSATAPGTPTSQFNSDDSEEQNFLDAGTLPSNFQILPLPVKLEKIDGMILHCRHLLNEDNNYTDEIKDKLISLHSFKCITMAQNNLAPNSAIKELEAIIPQVVETETERKKYRYLNAFVYLSSLASFPTAELYDNAISAINLIDETTPVLPSKTVGCYNVALTYYNKSNDKVAAAKLMQLLGSKMAMAKEVKIADMGLSLIDYPIFVEEVRESVLQREIDEGFIARTNRLLGLIRKTPPKSESTYNVLLYLPEHYLQAGSVDIASKILVEIKSAVAGADERFRNKLQTKIERSAKRIALFGKPFPLFGSDVDGKPLRPTKKNKTVVLFWSPNHKEAYATLARLHDSSLYNEWDTQILTASTAELTPEKISSLRNRFSHFRFLDYPTSKEWISTVGVSAVPYLMTVNKNGIVERFSEP